MVGQTISHYRVIDTPDGGRFDVVYKVEKARHHGFRGRSFSRTHIAWISVCLFVIVVANAVAQSSSTPTETEVCTAEDYAISTVALNDLFAKQKPDRVLL